MSPEGEGLSLFCAFHANLDFSAMPAVDLSLVVERCYWPLLETARSGLPIGIEMPARTLEILAETDPEWTKALRDEVERGRVELLGSGLAQVVAPLVPAEVNRANFREGALRYRELLGCVPETWFVNEQTYTRGLADLYLELGARQILMEWNNPASAQPALRPLRTRAVRVRGSEGGVLGLLWNDSIVFQRVQQVAHGTRPVADAIALVEHIEERWGGGSLCVYGGDLEIFDYRPGRPPGPLCNAEETTRLRELLATLAERHAFVLPRNAAAECDTGPWVDPASATDPMPCKKQPRYNPTRWAVSGRDGLGMNTRCHALHRVLRTAGALGATRDTERDRAAVELWRSDFRTRATEEKVEAFSEQMGAEQERAQASLNRAVPTLPEGADLLLQNPWDTTWIDAPVEVDLRFAKGHLRQASLEVVASDRAGVTAWQLEGLEVYRDGTLRRATLVIDAAIESGGLLALRLIPRHRPDPSLPAPDCVVETDQVSAIFNFERGAALRSLSFPSLGAAAVAGTIDHGHFLDIAHSPDFYSGHVVAHGEEGRKVTDLAPVDDARILSAGAVRVSLETRVQTAFGEWVKQWRVYRRSARIDLRHDLRFPGLRLSSLRLGTLTLLPEAIERGDFHYATVQGGTQPEAFTLAPGESIDQGRAISAAVSATSCLGATEGWCQVGDRRRGVLAVSNPAHGAAVPMLTARQVDDAWFCRLEHSAAEQDETRAAFFRGIRKFAFAWIGFGADPDAARAIARRIACGLAVRTRRGASIAPAL